MAFLFVRPNSRQIPYHTDYTASKDYDDMMYGYLQSISLPGEDGIRYVDAKMCKGTELAKVLGISPATANKRFKGLQSLMLVGLKQKGKFDLLLLANDYAILVPLEVLDALLRIKQSRAISLYAKFLTLAPKGQFEIHLTTMKNYVGLATTTYSNSHLITDPIEAMQSLGLLKYRQTTCNDDGKIVTKQYISNVTNLLK